MHCPTSRRNTMRPPSNFASQGSQVVSGLQQKQAEKIKFKTFWFKKNSKDRWRKQDFGSCDLGIENAVTFKSFYLGGFFYNLKKIRVRLKDLEMIFTMRSIAAF